MSVGSTRWFTPLLLGAAAIALFQAVALLTWYWPGGLPDTNTSGVWISLADDFAHGDFYRELVGKLGTGGTRYMPLFFVLQGTTIAFGVSPLVSGVVLTLVTAVGMLAATYLVLRAIEVPKLQAIMIALLLLGTVSFQLMLLTVRGDFLAAALNLAGVAATIRAQRRDSSFLLILAGILFAGAFLTKLTTVFGLVAMAGWLLSQKKMRAVVLLAATTACLAVGGVVLANTVSDGRMLKSFRAVADGGMTFSAMSEGPVRFATECAHDPLSLVLFAAASLAAVTLKRTSADCAAVIWFAGVTLIGTLVIFLSPGTSANHLMDLQAASLLVIAFSLAAGGASRICGVTGVTLLLVGMCITWLPGVPSIRTFFEDHGRPSAAAVRESLARAGVGRRAILAENPLIPILASQRPIVADWFNLRLLWRRDPALREGMLARLRAGEFGAVVLSNWPPIFTQDCVANALAPTEEQMRQLLARDDLPAGFSEALLETYRVSEVRRPFIYFVPRQNHLSHE